jgi:hypothetical protein
VGEEVKVRGHRFQMYAEANLNLSGELPHEGTYTKSPWNSGTLTLTLSIEREGMEMEVESVAPSREREWRGEWRRTGD